MAEQDPLFAEENRDRPVVTELTREENGQHRIARVARHPIERRQRQTTKPTSGRFAT